MRARVTLKSNGVVRQDKIWKDPKAFIDSTRGFLAGEIELHVVLNTQEDLDTLEQWVKRARLSLR